MKVGENRFNEGHFAYVDPEFFQFFSFPLIQGQPEMVLKEPNSVVITAAVAEKYFGEEDPIGKVIEVKPKPNKLDCKRVSWELLPQSLTWTLTW